MSDTEVALKLNLRVEPAGEPPFELWTKLRFSQFGMPRPGSKLAVIYDPEDHDSIMLDDSPQATIDVQMADMPAGMRDIVSQVTAASLSGANREDVRSLAAQLGQQYAATTQAYHVTPAAAAGEDPLDRLEKLADLRAKGILTEEEFQAQKAKILGSS